MKRINLLLVSLFLCFQIFAQTPWSQRMANSTMLTDPNFFGYRWDYVNGTVMSGFQALYNETSNSAYYNYIKATADQFTFTAATKTLDNIKEGTIMLFLYENETNPSSKTNYANIANAIYGLFDSSTGIGRTTEGGLWHKDPGYAWQMWGDGLYMAQPFYAQYNALFNNGDSLIYNDIANQFILFESHARNASTGLLYHGWSEQATDYRSTAWADPTTGLSSSYWSRAMGWYIMGLVDALDYFPSTHPKQSELLAILQRLVPAIIAYQDAASKCWYDVTDKAADCLGTTPDTCNYLEATASAMFTYSILKAVRLGYIDPNYQTAGVEAYEGFINTFIETKTDTVIINNCCQVSGLGGSSNRDGSFEYYLSEPIVTSQEDGKVIGPFILASLEYEAIQATAIKEPVTQAIHIISGPNPTKNFLNVQLDLPETGELYLAIINTTGKEICRLEEKMVEKGTYKASYNLPDINRGMYLLHCINNGQENIRKIMIE